METPNNTEQKPERKSFLIRADSQNEGKCSACHQAITWTFTRIGARMPMNAGFEIAEYVPVKVGKPEGAVDVTFLRVYADQSHFVTCKFAQRFKRGRAA